MITRPIRQATPAHGSLAVSLEPVRCEHGNSLFAAVASMTT
jgi:hypothetical protein